MSVRSVKCSVTIVNGAGAPQVGVTVQAQLVGPTGILLLDSAGEEIDNTPLPAVTNASGVAIFDPAASPTNGLIAPGGDIYQYISGSLVVVTGCYWQISYLQTILYSPAFVYIASTIDMATWVITPSTLGLIKFYLANVFGSGAPVLGRSFNVSLSLDAFWTGGIGTGQRIPGGASFPLTTDGAGRITAYVIRTSQLNPTTGAWQMPDLVNGGVTFWQAPDTYGAADKGVYAGGTTYALGDIVRRASDDEPFISLANANTGNALSDLTKWADYPGINIESIATTVAPIGATAAISQTTLAADSAVLTGAFTNPPVTLQDELRKYLQEALRDTGAWSGAVAYLPNDLVLSGGVYYLCILAHTNHVPPNATYWSVLGSGGGGTTAKVFVTKTANYTVLTTDTNLLGDATGGVITFTLPTASGSVQEVTIKRKNSGANAVNVGTTSAQTIDGAAPPYSLGTQWQSVTFVSDGTSAWFVE